MADAANVKPRRDYSPSLLAGEAPAVGGRVGDGAEASLPEGKTDTFLQNLARIQTSSVRSGLTLYDTTPTPPWQGGELGYPFPSSS